MNIGFDAKRAYHNNTGLGNYSRTLIHGLATYFPNHNYFLFNPKAASQLYHPSYENVAELLPQRPIHKKLSSVWRSRWVTQDIRSANVQLFHGLSGELPVGIRNGGVKSVVTIHDLIFERYPEQYGKINTAIYRKKFQYACKVADKVIAISQQTSTDLIELYKVDPAKIEICYQTCHPAFAKTASEELKKRLRTAYHLPERFFLSVGSIIERKNLLGICAGIKMAGLKTPLVVVGNGKSYREKVIRYLQAEGIRNQVHFLSEIRPEDGSLSLNTPENLAALYQMAIAMIYPSYYEGFGIPVLEALWSRLPVITSNTSCLPETAGNAALFVNPAKPHEIGLAMKQLEEDNQLRYELIDRGIKQAQNFTLQNCTNRIMNVYQSLL